MDKASEAILSLKPVTFRYKKQLDPDKVAQFGLIAEEAEKVNSDLITRDEEGKPATVRYDAVNAMLLNEFLKEHRKVESLEAAVGHQQKEFQAAIAGQRKEFEATISQQQRQIEALTTSLQGVSSQLEVRRPAPQLVANH
jgi:Chaperone of endosialidase